MLKKKMHVYCGSEDCTWRVTLMPKEIREEFVPDPSAFYNCHKCGEQCDYTLMELQGEDWVPVCPGGNETFGGDEVAAWIGEEESTEPSPEKRLVTLPDGPLDQVEEVVREVKGLKGEDSPHAKLAKKVTDIVRQIEGLDNDEVMNDLKEPNQRDLEDSLLPRRMDEKLTEVLSRLCVVEEKVTGLSSGDKVRDLLEEAVHYVELVAVQDEKRETHALELAVRIREEL